MLWLGGMNESKFYSLNEPGSILSAMDGEEHEPRCCEDSELSRLKAQLIA